MKDLKKMIVEFMEKHPWISSFLFLLFSLILVWQLWVGTNRAELRRLEAEIRERGEPLPHDDLNKFYKAVPDAENAALPYQEAFGKYHEASEEEKKQLIIVGTAPDLVPGERMSPGILTTSKAYLEKNKEAIELLKKAANMEKCRFPVDLKQVWEASLPYLSSMRQGARLLSLDAIIKAEESDIDSALDSLSAIQKTSKHLYKEPILISFLVGGACETIMMNALEHCINSAKFSEAQIKRAEEIISKLPELKTPARNAFLAERAFLTGTADKKLYNEWMYGLRLFSFGPTFDDIIPELFNRPEPFIFIMSGLAIPNRINYINYMNEAVEMARMEYDRKALDDFENKHEEKAKGIKGILCRMLIPAISSIFRKQGSIETRRSLMLLALAGRRFEHKHGHLPDKLEELVPEFITEVPVDIFDKKKMKIFKGEIELDEREIQSGESENKKEETVKIKGEGIIIYSVGQDGVDNSGGTWNKRNGSGRDADISVIILPIVD